MNEMENRHIMKLSYHFHIVHHYNDLKVMLIVLIENLVAIKEIVGMRMIVALDSLMMEVDRSLMVEDQKEKHLKA